MKNPKLIMLGVGAFFAFLLIVVLSSSMFMTIDAGNEGVMFKPFSGGVDPDITYGPGFHLIAPWNDMYVYDTRLQERTEEMDVLAKNGLSIHLDLSIRYKVRTSEIGFLHNEIGLGYADKVIIPEIRAATRKVIGEYLPEELYSSKREAIQTGIFETTETNISPNHLELDAVLIRSVKLPATIETAIESKLKQEQMSAEYEFKLTKEKKEADRKRIEAQGIKDFQDIVSEGINDKLLRWKGIEATENLAKSTNTKIVVIGGGKDGLPLILNQ